MSKEARDKIRQEHRREKKDQETTYLSGPIDMAPDWGVDWRRGLTPRLKELKKLTGLDIKVQDPIIETLELLGTKNMKRSRNILQRLWRKDRKKYFRKMKVIEKDDIDAVLRSDFIITYWDRRIITYGTTVENDVAARHDIPIYCVSYDAPEDLPNWLRKDLHKSKGELFESFDELVEFLKNGKKLNRESMIHPAK